MHEGAARCLLLPQQGVTIGRLVCIRQWQGKRASRLLSLRAILCLAAQQQHTGTLCICMHDMQARLYGNAQLPFTSFRCLETTAARFGTVRSPGTTVMHVYIHASWFE